MEVREFTHVDSALAEFAGRQGGVVSLTQLREKKVTRNEIGCRIATGHLHTVHPGVYSVGHATLTPDGRRWAAMLACGDGAALSHWSNAVHRGWLTGDGPRIDVSVVTARPRRLKGVHAHRAELGEHEIEEVAGLRCTSVARMLQELAATKKESTVERVWRNAVFHKGLDLRSVAELLHERRGERGIRILRQLYARRRELVGQLNGFAEDVVLPLIRLSSLPEPGVNDPIEVPGRILLVDFHFPELRLVVEADSRVAHEDLEFAADDAERDRLLRSIGYHVERVPYLAATSCPNDVVATFNSLTPSE